MVRCHDGVNRMRCIPGPAAPLPHVLMLSLVVMVVCGVLAVAEGAVQSLGEVRAIPLRDVDRAPTVHVRGVVTFRHVTDTLRTVTIQDDTAAMWVEVAPDLPSTVVDAIRVGIEVDVRGVLDPGGFAPRILASDVTILGERPLPEPRQADVDRLFAGADNGLRVSLRGVAQAFRRDGDGQAHLILASESRRLVVRVPDELLQESPDRFVDARLNVVGIVTASRNTRGEFLRPGLNVARPEDVVVIEDPPGGPFDAPEISLDGIARFRPEPNRGHRIRTRGIVTASFPGRVFYIQDDLHGVRVQTRSHDPIERGGCVEVAGFLDMSQGAGALSEAVYRDAPGGMPVQPVAIQPTEIVAKNMAARRAGTIAKPGNYAGCLITFTATHLESHPPYEGWCRMTLRDGAVVFTAVLPDTAYAVIQRIPPGSGLSGMGIADLKSSADETVAIEDDRAVDRVDVLVQSADDIAIVSVPSWWTPRRMAYALAAAIGGLGLSLGANHVLRRRITNQAERLAEEIRSRNEAAVEFQATPRERSRLASNLHDTVLQTVTGVGFQLQACRAVGESVVADSVGHLKIAERMVDHAVQQLRGTVWALHTVPAEGQSLGSAMRGLVERLGAGQAIKIEARIDGTECDVAEEVAGNLLLVAQEAIHNAIQHADATIIDLKVTFGRDGSITVVVRDDGLGFEPGSQPGSGQGHFGLEGMRDRMQRVGGTIAIHSEPGVGTCVTAVTGPR